MPRHAVAILAGALLAVYGNQLPDRAWSSYLPLLLLLWRFCPRWRWLLLAAAAHLWSLALLHIHLDHRLQEAYDDRVVLLRGSVDGIPQQRPGHVSFYLDEIDIDGYPGRLPRRVRVAWYQREVLPLPEERWQLVVRLRQPRGALNPAGFDFSAWQFANGIDAGGYVRASPVNRRLAPAGWFDTNRWRLRVAQAIDENCRDCPRAGLLKALAIGYRGAIENRHRQLLERSSTAHLLAISGLHIGMVALFAYLLGRGAWRLGLYRVAVSRPYSAALLAVTCACGYAAMAGFSLPTVRALIMLLVLSVALLLKNRVNLLQSLAIAVATITLADPRSLISGSFWLSCGALLVIAFAQFRAPQAMPGWRRLLVVQFFFTLLFAPVSVMIFGQWSPASLPANLLAIPAVSFLLLPAILLGSLLAVGGLPGAGQLLGVADRGLGLLLDCLQWLLEHGFEALHLSYPMPLLAILLALVYWMLMPQPSAGRHGALLAAIFLLAWQPARPGFGEFQIWILDVGMGTSILLRTRHHSLVYDLGPGKPGSPGAGDRVLLPLMRRLRSGAPDLVVVSHADQDHSGGLPALLDAYPQAPIVTGTPAELAEKFALPAATASCHRRQPWRWDGVEFAFLQALAGDGTNNRSCVLRVDGEQRVLLAGDIEATREASLVAAYGDSLAADMLLVPHHGSETSSSVQFLDFVAPRHAVFTLSRGNRWGFPSAAVVDRYRARGIRLYDTAGDGAISVASGARGLKIETLRGAPRRIWRRW
jgi:competence protein ComEC